MRVTVIDFETEPIVDGVGPPKPFALAWRCTGKRRASYTTDPTTMRRVLRNAYRGPVVGHGLAFDLAVAAAHLGLGYPAECWDTMVLAFLLDPFSTDLGLKPLGTRYLGRDPSERDELREWILNADTPTKSYKRWGQYIHWAHQHGAAQLVERYAKQDVVLTGQLYRVLLPRVRRDGMLAAARRECALVPILARLQLTGLGIDRETLHRDADRWRQERERLEVWLARKVGLKPDELGNSAKVMPALHRKGLISEVIETDKGNPSMKLEALKASDVQRTWLNAWIARQQRKAVLDGFVKPWLAITGQSADGRLHAQWYGTRGAEIGRRWGARTGRCSSSPNLMNIPKAMQAEGRLPKHLRIGDPPNLRSYIVPKPGHVLLQRDYSQQEMRILAHYAEGPLLQGYLDDPKLDVHSLVQQLVRRHSGLVLSRDVIKVTDFRILYGSGIRGLSGQLGIPYEEGREILYAVKRAIPGLQEQQDYFNGLDEHEPYWTWGQRRYTIEFTETMCPPSEWFDEWTVERKSYAYKGLNYRIQGSAADCTKTAMLAYDSPALVGQVHDELWAEVPEGQARAEMRDMQGAMEAVRFKLPMLTDGVVCRRSIAEAKQ